MLTIHVTMIYLHWLFKYRTDLKLLEQSNVHSVGMQFLEAMLKKEQTSCLHSVPIRSSKQVKTSVEREVSSEQVGEHQQQMNKTTDKWMSSKRIKTKKVTRGC